MKREYDCEVGGRQAPGRLPRDHHRSAASSPTRTRSRPAARASSARCAGTSSRCPTDAVETYEFVDDITGGAIPREFISARATRASSEAMKKGIAHRLPRRGRALRSSTTAQSHAVDSSEQAFKTAALMGFREAYERGQADHPRADHEGRGAGARGVPGRGRRPAQPAPRRPSSAPRTARATCMAMAEVPLADDVRLLAPTSARPPRARASSRWSSPSTPRSRGGAGRDDEGLPREAGRRATVVSRREASKDPRAPRSTSGSALARFSSGSAPRPAGPGFESSCCSHPSRPSPLGFAGGGGEGVAIAFCSRAVATSSEAPVGAAAPATLVCFLGFFFFGLLGDGGGGYQGPRRPPASALG